MNNDYTTLFSFLSETEHSILDYFSKSDLLSILKPDDIHDSVLSYLQRPAKRLRPSVLLMACGCLGGEERVEFAIPAAAGIELFHTWTLVHDDIIDNDKLRRGAPTVHEAMSERAKLTLTSDSNLAQEYGRDIAILTGDIQHGWSITSFIDCALQMSVDPMVILQLVRHLQTHVIGNLVYGEVLDVQFGIQNAVDMSGINEEQIVNMLWLKTGILYEFAGLAGALIGINAANFDDSQVCALKQFTSHCGTAFQLQDDILGILGNEEELGKPIGSDIREGKKTVIVFESLKNADVDERNIILSTLGNKHASADAIDEVTSLFKQLGGINRTKELAEIYIRKALPHLDEIPDSKYKQLLILWASFMINRKF